MEALMGWGGRRVTQARQRMEQYLPLPCSKCGVLVMPGMAWDIDHLIDRAVRPDLTWDETHWGVAHSHCNRKAGARAGNLRRGRRMAATPRLPTSRDW